MLPKDERAEMKRLIEETRKYAEENNKMLKSIRRLGLIEMALRLAWYAILIGLPFAIYYFVLDPYFALFGTSYEQFNAGIQELPGVDSLGNILRR